MYIFLKDHLEFTKGQKVKEHFNAQYLVAVGVIEEIKEVKKDKK